MNAFVARGTRGNVTSIGAGHRTSRWARARSVLATARLRRRLQSFARRGPGRVESNGAIGAEGCNSREEVGSGKVEVGNGAIAEGRDRSREGGEALTGNASW
jgi:hypothetical protein